MPRRRHVEREREAVRELAGEDAVAAPEHDGLLALGEAGHLDLRPADRRQHADTDRRRRQAALDRHGAGRRGQLVVVRELGAARVDRTEPAQPRALHHDAFGQQVQRARHVARAGRQPELDRRLPPGAARLGDEDGARVGVLDRHVLAHLEPRAGPVEAHAELAQDRRARPPRWPRGCAPRPRARARPRRTARARPGRRPPGSARRRGRSWPGRGRCPRTRSDRRARSSRDARRAARSRAARRAAPRRPRPARPRRAPRARGSPPRPCGTPGASSGCALAGVAAAGSSASATSRNPSAEAHPSAVSRRLGGWGQRRTIAPTTKSAPPIQSQFTSGFR